MAQTTYCNTTTDLLRAYPKVFEGFKEQRIISGYKSYSATVWMIGGTGYVEAMYEDTTKMTSVASINLTNSAQKYYYDTTNDMLYFYPTGSTPDVHTYKIGEDQATLLTDATQMASRDAEAKLDVKYESPLPMSPDGTSTRPYDRDFVHAVALLACAHVASRFEIARFDSSGNAAEGNQAAALEAAGNKIIQEYIDGKRVFSWEITEDEIGGHNIRATSTNTSAGIIQVRGKFNPDMRTASAIYPLGSSESTFIFSDPYWMVKIVLGGVLGTATFTVSKDNGTTYAGSTVATTNQWTHIDCDIWIRFLTFTTASVFVANDTWQLEIYGPQREITSTGMKSKPIEIL